MTIFEGLIIASLFVNVFMAYQLGQACKDIEILFQGLGSMLEDDKDKDDS